MTVKQEKFGIRKNNYKYLKKKPFLTEGFFFAYISL